MLSYERINDLVSALAVSLGHTHVLWQHTGDYGEKQANDLE